MHDQNRRRLTLTDVAVLMASIALGLAWTRLLTPWASTASGVSRFGIELGAIDYLYYIHSPANFVTPLLIPAMAALLLLRMLGPGPRLRRLAREPGAAACLTAMAVSIVSLLVLKAKVAFLVWMGGKFRDFPPYYNAFLLGTLGYAIAAVWLVMLLGGTWEAEPDWIDRSGRVLGACAVLLLFFPVML
jgi:hypothetical protein